MESLVEFVPPVLASIAGIFPILLESLPSSLDAKSKPLAIILLLSSIWVIYILMLSFGYSYTLFSPVITIITLAVGISVLAILMGLSLQHIKITEFWANILYIFSVICLVAGFSNHLLMLNNVVMRFIPGKECTSIEQLHWNDAKITPIRLGYVNSIFGVGVVWPTERFEKIEKLVVTCPNSNADIHSDPIEFLKEEGIYRPWGAGKSYEFRR